MSDIKTELLREIEEKIKRKKLLAKETSREKTLAFWVSGFFAEISKLKGGGHDYITTLALNRLTQSLRSVDKKCSVIFRQFSDTESQVEITWSKVYLMTHDCEKVLTMNASSADFESALEAVF